MISTEKTQKLVVLYLIIWSISPPLEIDWIYRLIAVTCTMIWFYLASKKQLKLQKEQVRAVMFALAVLVISIVEYGGFAKVFRPIALYVLVLAFIMNFYYLDRWHELAGIVPIVLLLFFVWNMKTVHALDINPGIARLIVRNDEATYEYLRSGVGGYGLIYPQVCILPAIVAWIIQAYKHHKKLLFCIGCLWAYSFLHFLLKASYATAIVTSILGLVMFFYYKKRSIKQSIIFSLILFFSALLAVLFLESFRESLLSFFDGTAVEKKINDLVISSSGDGTVGSIQERLARYWDSIKMIFMFPLIGGLFFKSGGGHSSLLDTFAKYGLWGGYIFVKMLFFVPLYYKKNYSNPLIQAISDAVFICILYVSFLNPFGYSFMFVVLIVLPLLYADILKWNLIEP